MPPTLTQATCTLLPKIRPPRSIHTPQKPTVLYRTAPVPLHTPYLRLSSTQTHQHGPYAPTYPISHTPPHPNALPSILPIRIDTRYCIVLHRTLSHRPVLSQAHTSTKPASIQPKLHGIHPHSLNKPLRSKRTPRKTCGTALYCIGSYAHTCTYVPHHHIHISTARTQRRTPSATRRLSHTHTPQPNQTPSVHGTALYCTKLLYTSTHYPAHMY